MSLFQLESISDQAQFLNPTSLPSLRSLAYYNEERGLLPGIEEALSALLPQLHIVSLDYNSVPKLRPESLNKLDPITLFDAHITDVEEKISVSHLRCDHKFGSEDYDNAQRLLSEAQLSLPLTIYFPLSASPDALDYFNSVADRRRLLETRTERGIEVVYEDSPEKWYLNSGFSEHFMEKMRKERRKRGGDV
ncbi:hypothetical protein JCM3765_006446 [Sporobolomyces pararoseus]